MKCIGLFGNESVQVKFNSFEKSSSSKPFIVDTEKAFHYRLPVNTERVSPNLQFRGFLLSRFHLKLCRIRY